MLLFSIAHAEFVLRDVEVSLSEIRPDGRVHVRESIRFLVVGDYEKALYESAFDRNDLSYWANITTLSELKLHLDPNRVNIPPAEFALRPQPLRGCNIDLNLCQGRLILEYNAYPLYNRSSGEPLPGTGVFFIEPSKPRVLRYSLNPNALAFPRTNQGDLRLSENIRLVIDLPEGARIAEEEHLNPKPDALEDAEFPLAPSQLEWSDLVLVKFTVIFSIEQSLDQEVVEFFGNVFGVLGNTLSGEQGVAIVLIVLLVLGGYLHLQRSKRRA